MKTFAIASVFVLLSAATASAGDLAVSKSTLDNMGLGGMQQLSDSDGLAVRGKGPFEDMFGNTMSSFFSSALGGIGDLSGLDLGGVQLGDNIFGGFQSGFPFGNAFGGLGLNLPFPM
ncbi:MAG: hypothetical protein WD063_20700 [Pirellulales bacterium]